MPTAYLFSFIDDDCDILAKIKANDIILAVDGGIDFLHKNNIVPDVWIGDFDSINKTKNFYKAKQIIEYPKDKDYTDTELAINWAYNNNCRKIVIINSLKGRFDHSFGQVANLLYANNLDLQASVYAKTCSMQIINNNYHGFALQNQTVSIFSLKPKTTSLTISGLKYEAKNITLKQSSCNGISNVGLGKNFEINFKTGLLLLIKENLTWKN